MPTVIIYTEIEDALFNSVAPCLPFSLVWMLCLLRFVCCVCGVRGAGAGRVTQLTTITVTIRQSMQDNTVGLLKVVDD